MQQDLTRLLNRLRREAGIDIRQIDEGQANITIEAVSQKHILPHSADNAACFVVPNSSSLEEYRRDRRKDQKQLDRTAQTRTAWDFHPLRCQSAGNARLPA